VRKGPNYIVQNWVPIYKPEGIEMEKLIVIWLYALDNHFERSKDGE
jgi:hypothetical protein